MLFPVPAKASKANTLLTDIGTCADKLSACSYAVLHPNDNVPRLKAKKLADDLKAAEQALMRAGTAYLTYWKVHPLATFPGRVSKPPYEIHAGKGTVDRFEKAQDGLSEIHFTADGQIHLWAYPDKEGGWKAVHWGNQLDGARHFATVAEANEYLVKSFREMFPKHVCDERCSTADDAA